MAKEMCPLSLGNQVGEMYFLCSQAECAWWLDDGCIKIAEVKAVEKLADVVRNHA